MPTLEDRLNALAETTSNLEDEHDSTIEDISAAKAQLEELSDWLDDKLKDIEDIAGDLESTDVLDLVCTLDENDELDPDEVDAAERDVRKIAEKTADITARLATIIDAITSLVQSAN